MTMVPAQTLSKHHRLYYCDGYVSYCGGSYTEEEEEEEEEKEYYETAAAGGLLGGSDLAAHKHNNPMAEDESRTTRTTTTTTTNTNEAAASSSKDIIQAKEDDASWLQLSIGGASAKTTPPPPPPRRGGGLVELDLLLSPAASREGKRVISPQNTPLTPIFPSPPPPPTHHQLHREINWKFRPAVLSIGRTNSLSLSTTSSSNPSSFMPYFGPTPFHLHGGGGGGSGGPSLDFRVIDPPSRKPNSGIWFSLQASKNQ